MELLLVVAVLSWVVKNGVTDLIYSGASAVCAVRGKPSPTWGRKSRVRLDGAASRYFSQLWNDSWEGALAKHQARRGLSSAAPDKPRGAATRFFAGLAQDGRRAAGRSWERAWDRADERRRARASRPRPGQQTVPGTVVPNRDETQDGPQDEARPDPIVVTVEDGTDLQFGDDPTDPTGTKQCPECGGTSITEDGICLSCQDRQEQRNQHHDEANPLAHLTPGAQAYEAMNQRLINEHVAKQHPSQEGIPTMTATSEVVGLTDIIRFCDDSAGAYRAQAHATERAAAAAAAGGVTGPAAAKLAHAMELANAAATAMDEAAAEFKPHLGIQEQYNANQGAGTREFVTSGQ